MELEALLADKDPASWEKAFRDYVQEGKISVDDWLWQWLLNRINWPSEDFSLFYKENVLVETQLFNTKIHIATGDNEKRRLVWVRMFESNPYHPDFEEIVQVEEHEWRFPSIGNPYIDEPNYTIWEKMLFAKLFNIAFEKRKGLDFLIERSRRGNS